MDYSPLYLPKFFHLEELVPKASIDKWGTRAWQFLDPRVLITLDRMRKRYDCPMLVNDWKDGGKIDEAGYRPPGFTTGAEESLHRQGKAADVRPWKFTAEEVRRDIKAAHQNQHRFYDTYEYVTAIELDVSWVHFDIRNVAGLLLIPKPK